ncbi:MAG: hypothetical protein HY736_13680 [Verrucomicrobia bacterium]|nr:hypothetical protein [Verrucomicrobiota bacterium]
MTQRFERRDWANNLQADGEPVGWTNGTAHGFSADDFAQPDAPESS